MKNDRDKIIARLSSTLGKLNAGECVSVSELAEEYNVSTKTIKRDIDAFSFLPIRSDKGRYSLEPYALGKLSFEDIKNFAAISGIKHLFPSLSDDFIADILNAKVNTAYLIKAPRYEDLTHLTKEFQNLSNAILQHFPIRCHYKEKQRLLYPYKLVNHHGTWYLVADDNGVLKNFSFSKITNLQILEKESFAHNRNFLETLKDTDSNWFSQTMFDVTLQISTEVAEYFLKRKILSNQTILSSTPAKLIVKTTVSYDEEILRIVQYWLPHIQIISPEYLQEKLIKMLDGYVKTT
ncbi:helix-turn-helix transcriptional regulator [Sulfuricurvum sp.]|uniref:helix-turn-helix transcriptional regulator n=1 Tax=Sulfuricurvum sp. TaxID=2025608 RepID=UPI002D66ACBA|nr:WYL domain-containing protein [Sulfuricurvum sp.]HZF71237.1 WYL domain-containing protein [Sulfuricurvum sp.]